MDSRTSRELRQEEVELIWGGGGGVSVHKPRGCYSPRRIRNMTACTVPQAGCEPQNGHTQADLYTFQSEIPVQNCRPSNPIAYSTSPSAFPAEVSNLVSNSHTSSPGHLACSCICCSESPSAGTMAAPCLLLARPRAWQ